MAQTGLGWGAGATRGNFGAIGSWPAMPPRTGSFLEVPAPFVWKVIIGASVASAVALWPNKSYLQPAVESLTPEFIRASKAIGDVSERTTPGAQPVYRNPIRHHIPGFILGPDDLSNTQ